MLLAISLTTSAVEFGFAPEVLGTSLPEATDLSAFAYEGGQLPGVYHVEVTLNSQFVAQQPLTFFLPEAESGLSGLQPCLSSEQLYVFGVREGAIPSSALDNQGCVMLSRIPYASMTFLFHQRQLLLLLPATLLRQVSAGDVDPVRWDTGVNAALLDYRLSSTHQFSRQPEAPDYDAQQVILLPGINLGAWRYRNYSQFQRSIEQPTTYHSNFNYLERHIGRWQSRLTLGDSNTLGDIFASMPFSGVQLSSDLAMLPNSKRSFSPLLWGIARTPARVTVTQGESLLYSGSVTPGPFELNDITPINNGVDVVVRVEESDGQVQLLTFPFATLPVLLREGVANYGLTAGRYRSTDARQQSPNFFQLTQAAGLSGGVTLYGGVQIAGVYQALSLGVGAMLGQLGALSGDRTQTQAAGRHGNVNRLRYSKVMGTTGSNIAAAYQHASVDYRTLESAIGNRSSQLRQKSFEFSLSQPLPFTNGYLSLRWLREHFQASGERTTFSGSYRQQFLGALVSLGISESQRAHHASLSHERLINLAVSLPFGGDRQNNYVGYGVWAQGRDNVTQTLNISGSAFEGQALSWIAQQQYGGGDQARESSVRGDYRGSYVATSAGYGYSGHSERLDYAVQGGMVLHAGGFTLSPYLGETLALIDASGAPGASLQDNPLVSTDANGYALVPHLSAYSVKALQISPGSSDSDYTLPVLAQEVIPTRGAVVKAKFVATKGRRVLMTLQRLNGQPVPFGASASLLESANAQGALVGEAGEVYLSGMPDSGALQVQWGNSQDQRCRVDYTLPVERPVNGIFRWSGECR
ncbi:TPA: fimbria/pilus outer membrane usher protein [Serratia fonticola]